MTKSIRMAAFGVLASAPPPAPTPMIPASAPWAARRWAPAAAR